ncbi:hypothetical protein F0562_003967 [Nyssa sinensis]|uniref:Uncharacterized protein n=1 Tax=Nyssa sinensis TaxID=561372 RepID=A0A5J5BXC0_9ASTE|nr:hypothetical protein F0562_003967 [Nyssa sinensis]
MEEVWKDINLASLHDQITTSNFRGMILQDFLARPFSKKPPPSVSTRDGSPAPPPATALSLNPCPDHFHFLGNSSSEQPLRPDLILQSQPVSNLCSLNVPFDAMEASSSLLASGKKRFPHSDNNSGDRLHKRLHNRAGARSCPFDGRECQTKETATTGTIRHSLY